MTTPAIYYVNLGFAWFLVLMSIWGYVAIYRNTGQKWSFWLFFGLAWIFLGVSHIFTLGGASSSDWYMMMLRVAGYLLLIISVLNLMVRIVSRESV
jgi:hypothetical protein